ncbi:RDD family protein [Flavobacterium sp. UBA7663]|uniref:RDD family protein n=1 Tax=Flavobacterium sp. UBA7663 TaxID=1946557 RepID=UPI0025B90EDA|nr:RDD family protein [Flavobacterium sp. UBA7663]
MKNKITLISIFYCILGTLIYFIDFEFLIKNNSEYVIHIFNFFSSIRFDFLLFENELEIPLAEEGSYRIIPLNSIIFTFVLLIGSLLYFISNEKKTRLLRLAMLFFFIAKSVHLFFLLFNITESIKTYTFLTLYYIFIDIFWLFLAYKALVYLNSLKELMPVEIEVPKPEIKTNSTERVSAREIMNQSLEKKAIQLPFEKASIGDRLLNYLFDTFFVILIFSPYIFGLAKSKEYRDSINELGSEIGENVLFLLFIALGRIIYYLLSEGIFHISPAKALTETQVYATSENKLNFTTITGRTFIRLIPFEAFSFFGKNGWHDELSNTTVLKNKQNLNTKIYSILFLLVIFIASIINGIWDKF